MRDGVEEEVREVSRRRARQVTALGAHDVVPVEPAQQVRQGAAGVGEADPERRDAIEDAAVDQPRRRHRRVEGVAEEVVQVVGAEALAADDVDRVEEHRDAERRHRLEEGEVRRIVELPPSHVGAEVHAPAAALPDRAPGLGHRGLRRPHRQGGEPHEPPGMGARRLRHGVVDQPCEPDAEGLVGPVHHGRHERERVHGHGLGVHGPDPEIVVVVAGRDRAEGDRAHHDEGPVGTAAEPDAEALAVRLDQVEISLGNEGGVDVHGGRSDHARLLVGPRPPARTGPASGFVR
jgi:hypothetical protein